MRRTWRYIDCLELAHSTGARLFRLNARTRVSFKRGCTTALWEKTRSFWDNTRFFFIRTRNLNLSLGVLNNLADFRLKSSYFVLNFFMAILAQIIVFSVMILPKTYELSILILNNKNKIFINRILLNDSSKTYFPFILQLYDKSCKKVYKNS